MAQWLLIRKGLLWDLRICAQFRGLKKESSYSTTIGGRFTFRKILRAGEREGKVKTLNWVDEIRR